MIDAKLVRENVGGWRTRAVWDIVDAAADGRAADALMQLDRLVSSGEKPHGMLPQMASSLRKFDTATRLIEAAEADRRPHHRCATRSRKPACLPSSCPTPSASFATSADAAREQLTGWLLAADLAIKGHNSADDRARIELERLIVKLAAGAGSRRSREQQSSKRQLTLCFMLRAPRSSPCQQRPAFLPSRPALPAS